VKYTRIYSDPDGDSHFEDVEVELKPVDVAPPAPPVNLAVPMASERVILMSFPPGFHGDWHPAPRRQLYLQLSGELELRVSDGGTRTFPAGTAFLLEDVSGKGHVTRALGTSEVRGAIVQLS